MTNRNKLIELCKKLLPKFSQELKKCKDYKQNEHLEYIYILDYVKKIYDKDKTTKTEYILNFFDKNMKILIIDFNKTKKNNNIMLKAVNSAIFYKFFNDVFECIEYFVFNKKLITIDFLQWKNKFAYREAFTNACEAYPPHNRPRGVKYISSVEYQQSLIKSNIKTLPI